MTELAAATRSIVIEREMPHPPEKVWRALTQGPLIEEWLMKNDLPISAQMWTARCQELMGVGPSAKAA
jgi:uncharacterized protein YndB with AHSA1/START domain